MRTKKKSKVKIRKSIRYFYLASITLILACSSFSLLEALVISNNTEMQYKEIYSYENKFIYNYKVNLLDNPYMDEDVLEMGESAYVTDLIGSIDILLDYNYEPSEKSNIDYEYSVKGYIEGSYTKDGEVQKIWKKQIDLIDAVQKSEETDIIDIKEDINLNLKQKNNLVKQFEQELGMNIDAKYLIVFDITTKTQIDDQEIVNKYVSSINIDLAEKTTKIAGENNREDKEYVSKKIGSIIKFNFATIIINVALVAFSSITLMYVLKKTKPYNHVKNKYRYELNKILRLCQDKVVQLKNPMEIGNEQLIDVSDFEEVIKVSEELLKPILYWIDNDKEEAWFYVAGNRVTYRYMLK